MTGVAHWLNCWRAPNAPLTAQLLAEAAYPFRCGCGELVEVEATETMDVLVIRCPQSAYPIGTVPV